MINVDNRKYVGYYSVNKKTLQIRDELYGKDITFDEIEPRYKKRVAQVIRYLNTCLK